MSPMYYVFLPEFLNITFLKINIQMKTIKIEISGLIIRPNRPGSREI